MAMFYGFVKKEVLEERIRKGLNNEFKDVLDAIGQLKTNLYLFERKAEQTNNPRNKEYLIYEKDKEYKKLEFQG